MQKLYINEIFYSLQGEGARQGSANIFIRLAGCNLKCSFCDTKFNDSKLYLLGELQNELQKYYPCKNIIWTGGEPTLQLTNEIVDYFKELGYYQSIETNGSNYIPSNIDYISISPKVNNIHSSISKVNEVRLLYPYFFNKWSTIDFNFIYDDLYISPAFNNLNVNYYLINECINIVKENPRWKLSIQIHKLLNIE